MSRDRIVLLPAQVVVNHLMMAHVSQRADDGIANMTSQTDWTMGRAPLKRGSDCLAAVGVSIHPPAVKQSGWL